MLLVSLIDINFGASLSLSPPVGAIIFAHEVKNKTRKIFESNFITTNKQIKYYK
jgi:hypothetical protein